MSTARSEWPRIEAALDGLLALPESRRDAELVRIARTDPALAQELRSLVQQLGGDDPVLDRTALQALTGLSTDEPVPQPPGLSPGTRLGPWCLIGLIGRGGMGEVYRAERSDGQFEQQVAIKLMRIDSAAEPARFRQERQIVARLDHPGIARLIDGDVSVDGRPYMVMEFVDGHQIIDWCAERAPSLEQRLALFTDVCNAVAYAHRNLIVHRDLKPANVLVTPEGRTQLLDFGIARLIDSPAAETTRSLMLTPGYAAPEQLSGGPVTTAADVHALGLLLHELLCGRPAYDVRQLSLAAAMQQVISQAAPAPSQVARESPSPPVPALRLAGDLDAIVAKALRKEPERRYASVDDLQDDVQSFLRHEPVRARRGGWAYVAGRTLRRHRAWAVAGCVAVLAVAGGTGAVAWQASVARDEAARATAVKNFLLQVFKASDPRIAADKPRGQATARELLDAGAGRVERDFKDSPVLQLELMSLLANIYGELDESKPYETMQARRLALARQYPGRFVDTEVDVLLDRASDDIIALDRAKARQHLAEADRLLMKAGLDDSVQRAQWWVYDGDAMEPAKLAEREQAFRKAIALYDRVGPHDPFRPTALGRIGAMQFQRGNYAEAALWFQRTIEARKDSSERNDAEAQIDWGNLGAALANLGRNDEAARAYEQSSALGLKTYGEHYQIYWWSESQRAKLLSQQGHRDEAERIFQRLLTLAPYPPTVGGGWAPFKNYAATLAAEGDSARGLRWAEDAERFDETTPYESTSLRADRLVLGDIDEQLGRIDEARHMLQAAFDEFVKIEPADRRSRLAATERWARFLLDQHEIGAARRLFAEVLAQDHGRSLAPAALAQAGLARADLAEGQASAAREAGTAAARRWAEVRGFRDVRMGVYIDRVLAQALLAAGEREGAGAAAAKALADSQRYDAPGAPSISEARTLQQQAMAAAPPLAH